MFGLNCYCLKLSTATCTTKKKNPSSIKIYQPKTLLAEKKTLQEIIIYILTFPNLLKKF